MIRAGDLVAAQPVLEILEENNKLHAPRDTPDINAATLRSSIYCIAIIQGPLLLLLKEQRLCL